MPPTYVPERRCFETPKHITAVGVASDSLQTKYAADFLREAAAANKGVVDKNTAIVLTDESLLSPLLYSLPDEVGTVNITMGYPLKGSLAYSFVERLLLLQQHIRTDASGISFYHADVTGLLSHPYLNASSDSAATEKLRKELISEGRIRIAGAKLTDISPLTDMLFVVADGWRTLADWLLKVLTAVDSLLAKKSPADSTERRLKKEMFELIAEQINTLTNSLSDCEIEINN